MGFVKFERKIKDWGWYTDVNTFKVFFHLVLIANYTDKEFLGKVVKRGQVVIGTTKLAQEVGLTRDEVRTAIKHLELTNEITRSLQGKYTLYTITNYNHYQGIPQRLPNDFPTTSQRLPNDFPTIQEYKENKEIQEVVVNARTHVHACDDCNEDDEISEEGKVETLGGYGKQVVRLSEKQISKLLDELGLEGFDFYVSKLADFIERKGAKVGGHYRLIRKWAREDAKI